MWFLRELDEDMAVTQQPQVEQHLGDERAHGIPPRRRLVRLELG